MCWCAVKKLLTPTPYACMCIISLCLPILFPCSLLFFLLIFTYLLPSRICTRSVSRPEVIGGDRPNLGLVCFGWFCYLYFLVKDACLYLLYLIIFVLRCYSCLPCCRRERNNLNEPLDPFPFFGWLLNKKAARVEVNILIAFLHWVKITLHPWPFVSDIAVFVLKRDVKLQLTNCLQTVSSITAFIYLLYWPETAATCMWW